MKKTLRIMVALVAVFSILVNLSATAYAALPRDFIVTYTNNSPISADEYTVSVGVDFNSDGTIAHVSYPRVYVGQNLLYYYYYNIEYDSYSIVDSGRNVRVTVTGSLERITRLTSTSTMYNNVQLTAYMY
jgi:hypothetical protein